MLAQTSFAISHDESRYALNGVLFAVQEKELRMVATDGHRLALAVRQPRRAEVGDASGIVPRKAVQEIARIVGVGRGGRGRDQRQPVHAADAERAPDGAADRGDVPELRAGGPAGASRTA